MSNPAAATSTTTVSSTALSDHLPASIPRFEPSGLNWPVFSIRFEDAVEAKGFWGHFDGTKALPKPVDAAKRSAKSLLTQKLPDSALMRIRTKKTVRERWEAIVADFTEKGTFAQTEMRARFLDSKCPDKGNVKEFLDELVQRLSRPFPSRLPTSRPTSWPPPSCMRRQRRSLRIH